VTRCDVTPRTVHPQATFDITLTVAGDLTALSNMPVVGIVPASDGRKTYKYGRTPLVSTYLIAFVVGELERISGRTPEGVEMNVYTTPGKKEVRPCRDRYSALVP
jgi:puromycin-sensitive aminopeptidase